MIRNDELPPTGLPEARAAFARHAWAQARDQLSAADRAAPLGVDDLERLATATYLTGGTETSAALWDRAHREALRRQDLPRAARCIFWLVLELMNRGEWAPASGWLARAQRLLDQGARDCAERGLLLALHARALAREGDGEGAQEAAAAAAALADRFDDAELHVFSRVSLAQAWMLRGQSSEAAALLDEIMVAVLAGDASPIAIGVVYCAVIDACEYIFDYGRAREWTAALTRWCSAQPGLVPFRGKCLVHRAEIMRLGGAWAEALHEAEHACTWLGESIAHLGEGAEEAGLPTFHYPVGAAWYQIAEIHRGRGDLARAEAAYEQASAHGQSAQPGLALLRFAQGRRKSAEGMIRRLLGERQSRPLRAQVLAAAVEIMTGSHDLSTARSAADELATFAGADNPAFLRALSGQAMGSVLLAERDAPAAVSALRAAWTAWQEIEAPYEAARVRVLLGLAYRMQGDAGSAELEFAAARRVFRRVGAEPDVARVGALEGSTTGTGARTLTRRELQVIALLATGRSNRAIAQELAISIRTVDRHVSNILLKLELPSRSAATAYAYEHGLIQ